ncbi:hypothetical protein ABIA32_006397 [Streptacidiphilus sp. MAP12-20]|uniref:hypothetical protein n=1 Tax=Streptacidiphilus sp. MAP12-20 TaxID=3156299 RepID=UPI003511B5B6
MADDVRERLRSRLEAVAQRPGLEDPQAPWGPARELEQDVALLRAVLLAAAASDGGQASAVSADELGAALSLFEHMRNQVDRLETQVVIEARRRGMEWKQIAPYQGLGSSQAATQRYQRLMTRLEEIRQGVR